MSDFAFRKGPGRPRAERVSGVAIRVNGKVHYAPLGEGYIHSDLYEKVKPHDSDHVEEGFTTTHGRYVDRKEAGTIAMRRRQSYASKGVLDEHGLGTEMVKAKSWR